MAVEVNGLLSPIISRKEHMPDVVSYLIVDPHILTYTLAGFLWGHIVCMGERILSYMAIAGHFSSYCPRLVVIVGSLLWIRNCRCHYDGTYYVGFGD